MKLKTISKAIAGLALAAGFAGSASAFTITVGNYKVIADSYDAGTLYPAVAGVACGGPTATPANIASCDAAGVQNVGTLGPTEDSWGILSVSSITNITTNTTEFSRGADGYLIGYFGGLEDFGVVVSAVGFGGFDQKAYSTGGYMNLYKSLTDYNPAVGPTSGQAAVQAAATGYELFLSAAFEAGADAAVPEATYVNNFSLTSGFGSGNGFLSFNGGSALGQFDTNTIGTYAFTLADSIFTTTISPFASCTSPTPDVGCGVGWLAKNSSDLTGYAALPEPGSMALVGLGLIGLAGLRRRKQA